jgi:tetrahydromethanopterin S-methyltransferase subunit B
MPSKFEPLRNMESFTEDMFNQIISFQEKKHHAWNNNLSFDARIKDLPLHNLIFSNPDRDPQKSSATVAAFYPLREEMQKIAFYVQQLADKPVVRDLFPGNGFIGSLLGREGVEVFGHQGDTKDTTPNQIESFFDAEHFSYKNEPLDQLPFDAALVAWPASDSNPSEALIAHNTKLIIYIFTEHVDPDTQQRQTGSDDMLKALDKDYRLIDSWDVVRPANILHDIWPDMTPSIEETRHVHIYAHNSVDDLQPAKALPPAQSYSWEKDLQMALLALQAKQEVQSRGFPA